MSRKRGSRRRGGWRHKDGKLQAYVRVHSGTGGLKTRTYPPATSASDIQQWIEDTYTDYRRKHPRGAPGTLAKDVETYLPLLIDRPALHRDRTFYLAWWCERFGDRARWSLQPVELEAALTTLTAGGAAASTVKKYRTALFHLFTKLDGKRRDNPLRDVPPPREPDPLPRAIPYEIIDEIFAHMPERGQGLRHQRRGVHSKAKARLRLMAYVGFPPALIRAIEPGDYHPEEPSLLARGRKKGGGTRPERLPLTPRGVAAIEAFIAADAFERPRSDGRRSAFSMSSVLRAWRSAINRMCTALEQDPATRPAGQQLRRELARAVPYDLRHSFLTEVQLATSNIHVTQRMGTHADPRTTRRYTLAAVAPELKSAALLLAQRRAGQLPETRQPLGNEPPRGSTTNAKKPRKLRMARAKGKRAKIRTKLRKIS